MIPSTLSSHQLEYGEQLNPDSSKVTSDPKSDGKHKRKKDNARDKTLAETGDTEEADDQIAADPDPLQDTSVVSDQPPSKKSRRPGWKVVEMQATTITNLTREVDTLKAALEQAQRIHRKDPPISQASSSDEENASDINAFDNNVDPMDNQSTPKVGRKQPPPTTPSTSVLRAGGEKGIVNIHVDPNKRKSLDKAAFSSAEMHQFITNWKEHIAPTDLSPRTLSCRWSRKRHETS